jgi:small subunit ribosomal protein S5
MAREEDTGLALARAIEAWVPKTEIGKKVKAGEVTDIVPLLTEGKVILESEIVDVLVPGLTTELLLIGQSKGKFGGGQRRAFRQTQKKTKEGNKPSFTTFAVVGNRNGLVGLGSGKAKETVPAREKAGRAAKLNMIFVPRGSGSWQAAEPEQNSVPFKVTGKSGSIKLTLIPAPKGSGLVVEKECQKILQLAGIKDVWSKMEGKTSTKMNVVKACFDALTKISDMKVTEGQKEMLGMNTARRAAMKEVSE